MGDGLRITYTAAIADRATAIQRSGSLEGGGMITYQVPESEMAALAAHIPLVRVPLRITVEVDTAAEMAEPAGEPVAEAPSGRPAWAGERKQRARRSTGRGKG